MEGKAAGGTAVYFNPVQVDMQWIRRVQKEERSIMDTVNSQNKSANKVDDVF